MTLIDQFNADPVIRAAVAKLAPCAEGFQMYKAGWLGDIQTDACVMEVVGCVFREAKSGPNKGFRTIRVPGTDRRAFLTAAEVKALVSADA